MIRESIGTEEEPIPRDTEKPAPGKHGSHALALDVLAAEVSERMNAAGLGCILLQGPALAQWLCPRRRPDL